MKTIYYVANGGIEIIELIKETPRFYKIKNSSGIVELMSKLGYETRIGRKSFMTLDLNEAINECKMQIKKMDDDSSLTLLKIGSAKKEFESFIVNNKAIKL